MLGVHGQRERTVHTYSSKAKRDGPRNATANKRYEYEYVRTIYTIDCCDALCAPTHPPTRCIPVEVPDTTWAINSNEWNATIDFTVKRRRPPGHQIAAGQTDCFQNRSAQCLTLHRTFSLHDLEREEETIFTIYFYMREKFEE